MRDDLRRLTEKMNRESSNVTRHYLGTGHRMREDVVTVGNNFEIEDAPSGFKSPVAAFWIPHIHKYNW